MKNYKNNFKKINIEIMETELLKEMAIVKNLQITQRSLILKEKKQAEILMQLD